MSEWIEWLGHGGCPVPGGTKVEVLFRGGSRSRGAAGALQWAASQSISDIVAYRVVNEDPTPFPPIEFAEPVEAVPGGIPTLDAPGYERLANVLHAAFTQAASGKGKERHARDAEPFHEQVILQGAKRFGHGALLFQAYKKSEESQRLPKDRAIAELHGAIVYLAAAVIALEDQ